MAVISSGTSEVAKMSQAGIGGAEEWPSESQYIESYEYSPEGGEISTPEAPSSFSFESLADILSKGMEVAGKTYAQIAQAKIQAQIPPLSRFELPATRQGTLTPLPTAPTKIFGIDLSGLSTKQSYVQGIPDLYIYLGIGLLILIMFTSIRR